MIWPNATPDCLTLPRIPGKSFLEADDANQIIWIEVLKATHIFVAITQWAVYLFRLKPFCPVAVFCRNEQSFEIHGPNRSCSFRPDGRYIAITTDNGYIFILKILAHDMPLGEICVFGEAGALDAKQSLGTFPAPGEGPGVREVHLRYQSHRFIRTGVQHTIGLESRLVIVSKRNRVCTLDWDELDTEDYDGADHPGTSLDDDETNNCGNGDNDEEIAANEKNSTKDGKKFTEGKNNKYDYSGTNVDHVAWSKAMGLFSIIRNGTLVTGMLGYLGQPGKWFDLEHAEEEYMETSDECLDANSSFENGSETGHLLQRPPIPRLVSQPHVTHMGTEDPALLSALNARFSAVAVGCKSGSVYLYNIRDYSGNIKRIRVVPPPSSSAGIVCCLRWSMDGYALFVGYETGWALYSVYGMMNGSSFLITTEQAEKEPWLASIGYVAWSLSADRIFLCNTKNASNGSAGTFWSMNMVRWGSMNNFLRENLQRPILIGDNSISVYRGHNQPGLTTIDRDALLWLKIPIPGTYVADNWPIKYVSSSADGRYIAVAGSRGLAHYSLYSGRWKLFVEEYMDMEFSVRGMLWGGESGDKRYLFAAVDTDRATHEVRVYSRDEDLHPDNVLAVREFIAPVLRMCLQGSLLFVYTHDNILHIYQVRTISSVALYLIRKVSLADIVHSPARVRSISCLCRSGSEPEVFTLSLIFLIDGMLTILRPNAEVLRPDQKEEIEVGAYSKSILHHAVEYCHMTDDGMLWGFDGQNVLIWDVQDDGLSLDIKTSVAAADLTTRVPIESYPVAVLVDKGIIAGIEIDTVFNRNAGFTSLNYWTSTQLFVPFILEAYLVKGETDKAVMLAKKYRQLKYMSHILEMLLYRVMDGSASESTTEYSITSEDNSISGTEAETGADSKRLLSHAVQLVCQFPQMLDVFLGCTRKTEIKYWGQLFDILGSPQELFERCLTLGKLKTAAGYLLVLHTVEKASNDTNTKRLLELAYDAQDFELCKELARFLTAIDPTGKLLRSSLDGLGDDHASSTTNVISE